MLENKWMRAAVPALLIHCSIGTVYCWSSFKESIAESIGMSSFAVGWAFSLAIFFLGMSAAFVGRLVERDVHKSSLISCICFTVGMFGTGFFIQFTTGVVALIGIFISYGCVMGIGLGIGYLTPVKTLMLWFEKQKGLATGISIMGFGLAKAISTPFMELIQNQLGISYMFYILGAVYFVMMFIGHLLLKKPAGWVEPSDTKNSFKVRSLFKNKTFIGIWLMFYINIHCGLALISYEKQILTTAFVGCSAATTAVIIAVIPSVTAGFNAFGRIGFSTLSDHMKDRNTVYKIIFSVSILITAVAIATQAISGAGNVIVCCTIVIALLIIINAGYGGGFSTLPALLYARFGMENVSKIHGLALSAWAIAGLTGNNMSELILNSTNKNYNNILIATICFYICALLISIFLVSNKKKKLLKLIQYI